MLNSTSRDNVLIYHLKMNLQTYIPFPSVFVQFYTKRHDFFPQPLLSKHGPVIEHWLHENTLHPSQVLKVRSLRGDQRTFSPFCLQYSRYDRSSVCPSAFDRSSRPSVGPSHTSSDCRWGRERERERRR